MSLSFYISLRPIFTVFNTEVVFLDHIYTGILHTVVVLLYLHRYSSFCGSVSTKFYYNSSLDKIGYIPHNTDDIPVPPQFKIPSSCQMSMSPHELELMLFINESFLSPSIFDKVMKWVCSATGNEYKFDAPSYSKFDKTNGLHIPQYY